jgi:mannose-6-phosphate isomerase-like protein (cupin superfamily)
MPVINGTEDDGPRGPSGYLNEHTRPAWSDATSAGLAKIPVGGHFDRHFHDCNEYWFVFAGKAKVVSEETEYYLQRGDILCTRAGDEHDILEVYEDLELVWYEDATPSGGRTGHLHKESYEAARHTVLSPPLPADFPSHG